MMQSLAVALPPGLGAASFYIVVAASFFSSFLTSAFGVGGGVLLLATLAGVIQPAALGRGDDLRNLDSPKDANQIQR